MIDRRIAWDAVPEHLKDMVVSMSQLWVWQRASLIAALPTREARRQALDGVCDAFRELVRDDVIKIFERRDSVK